MGFNVTIFGEINAIIVLVINILLDDHGAVLYVHCTKLIKLQSIK